MFVGKHGGGRGGQKGESWQSLRSNTALKDLEGSLRKENSHRKIIYRTK